MKIIGSIIYYLFLLLLPFILLVRVAVYIHEVYALNGWISLAISGGITTVLMIIYFSIMYSKFTGKIGTWMGLKRRMYAAGFMVFAYIAYTLFFISGENVKYDALRKEFRELHPILRLGVSTLVIADRKLIITDASRVPEDYKKMGLKTKGQSLHYKQSSGFTHAIDLRTNNRAEWENTLVKTYFGLMGFNTLRHVGTDDHLHVSLMSHDRPGAK